MTGRERVLRMIAGESTDALPLMPITMMFASDHAEVRYRDYATDFRVLAEAQVRVAEDYDFDFVSVISDPGREAADCGATVVYFDDQPPAINEMNARLSDKTALASLSIPDPLGGGRMYDRVQGVARLKELVGEEKLVEGWVEGPCAEASDLRGINGVMMDFLEDPDFVCDLFDFVTEMALQFGKAQIEAGADIIGVGDAAASLVGPHLYEQYVYPREERLVKGLQEMGGRVRLHICGNTTPILEGMGRLGCEIVDLDSMVSMSAARAAMGAAQVLLGNVDPVAVMRNGTAEGVLHAISACHTDAGNPYIVSAGCEVPRGTPVENMQTLRTYARNHVYS